MPEVLMYRLRYLTSRFLSKKPLRTISQSLQQYVLPSTTQHNHFRKYYNGNTEGDGQERKIPSSLGVSNTIYALSSGKGKCGIAVIRISGPKASLAIDQICHLAVKPRIANLRKLHDPHTQEILDEALVLWFPGPHSFTGEDSVEFHVHGGPAVITSVLAALSSLSGFRPALPGEFAKQAFLNGKLDLTEVEGLGDLIHAETELQRKQALRQMGGELGHMYAQWRTRLIKCMANTEAFIDFHEEENIEDDILESVTTEVFRIRDEILNHLNDSRRGERLRDGLHVVILGEPNVGKSSLLNALCQRPAAIVSPIAGTTRDIVETALNIAGYPVMISDTAGLRETEDLVEKEGVLRAINRASSADLKILVLEQPSHGRLLKNILSLNDFVSLYMQNLGLQDDHITDNSSCLNLSNILIVLNKSDMASQESLTLDHLHEFEDHVCSISCQTGLGFDIFMKKLVNKLKNLCGNPVVGSPSLTQARHRHHLDKCQQHLSEFTPWLQTDVVLAAEHLRLAARELGQITGLVSTDNILDVIFRDFCIGK
ncbi:tRNA modification GTPase GTPBP3, mitochondrial-like isoform X2 [Physella acuta]|uniref:tRNA modification GTPase GTPBP3, mitochondrial-like isoform X2 n=1 Tax=Physella acuta TaxID=109671 RepID=UPI0027DC1793|nr:tRNA modification GTPase GTPBP3, mitochondrial-like isoform X2 [Physella acuta]